MSNDFNQLHTSPVSIGNENSDVASFKGGRSFGNLSKGMCKSSYLSSKTMKSNILHSKSLHSKLNSFNMIRQSVQMKT